MKLGLTCNLNGLAVVELTLKRLNPEQPVLIQEVQVVFLHQTKEATFIAGTIAVQGTLPQHLVDKAEEFVALLEDHLASSPVFGAGQGTNYIQKDDPVGIV